jgi:hypothetical protein
MPWPQAQAGSINLAPLIEATSGDGWNKSIQFWLNELRLSRFHGHRYATMAAATICSGVRYPMPE